MTTQFALWDPPYQPHSATSRDAAEAIKPSASTLRAQVLAFIKSRGSVGATDEEIQVSLAMSGNTERPRRRELYLMSKIKEARLTMFEIRPIEILALRKLELVSKALATKLKGEAGREQQCLADTLGDVLDRYQIETAKPK